MIFKIALANIKKSFKDYTIYFCTLILGVSIFYLFNSIDSQTAMISLSETTAKSMKLFISFLGYVSIFVSCVLGFLILYASGFLIKKRNKEFGIYLTLGMSKKKVSKILLMETFLIGILSLGVGLIAGICLSQVTSLFVAKAFEADMERFAFNFSMNACIKTIIYFAIIYLVVMIFNAFIIARKKIILLIHGSRIVEEVKNKNMFLSILLFAISICSLSIAYYMVSVKSYELIMGGPSGLIIPIILGVTGTELFFFSLSGIILKVLPKFKRLYYKDYNIFIFKQISSKINTFVSTISIICVLLFLVVGLLATSFSMTNYLNASLKKIEGCDYQIAYQPEDGKEKFSDYKEFEERISELIGNNTDEIKEYKVYKDEQFTIEKSFGDSCDEIEKKYSVTNYGVLSMQVPIFSSSDYNNIAETFGFKKAELKDDEYTYVSSSQREVYCSVQKTGTKVEVFGNNLKPAYKKSIYGFHNMANADQNGGFIVVPDSILEGKTEERRILFGKYNTQDKDRIYEIDAKLKREFPQVYTEDIQVYIETKMSIKDSSICLSAMVTFIALYLGIIFLICAAAILALKELSESLNDRNKYTLLRKIGASEKDISKLLFKQTLIFFLLPLLLAGVHSIFGLIFSSKILYLMGINNTAKPIALTSIFIVLIYGGYFGITYLASRNVIKEIK